MPLKWNDKQFKQALLKTLADNAEAVGIFVEVDARRRLTAITEPEWGAGYRRQIVARLLQHQVEVKPNEVTITVGVGTTPGNVHHGYYIELGSRRFPAHPFLRPAVFQNGAKIVRMLGGK